MRAPSREKIMFTLELRNQQLNGFLMGVERQRKKKFVGYMDDFRS